MSEKAKEKKVKKYATRNTEGGKYFYISNPTVKNQDTGYFCVSWSFLKYPYKDFIFEYPDPDTGKVEKKVLNHYYVKKHAIPLYKWYDKLDAKGNPIINPKTGKVAKQRGEYRCHRIQYVWINRYENLVAKGLAPAPMRPLSK